jgi:hypothetical protein
MRRLGLHRQQSEPDDDPFLKLLKLQSIKTQLEEISPSSAIELSQRKTGLVPSIPANSPLSNQSGPHRQQSRPDDDLSLKLLKLRSLKTQLEEISPSSAIKLSQRKTELGPSIPADSPLSNQSAPSFSMLSSQTQHSINLRLPSIEEKKESGFGVHRGGLGFGINKKEDESQGIPNMEPPDGEPPFDLYMPKEQGSKTSGGEPVGKEDSGDPSSFQQRLKDVLESVEAVLTWTIRGRRERKRSRQEKELKKAKNQE